MNRIFSTETVNKVGEEVLLKGWVNARRNMGKIAFLDLRDAKDKIQVVCVPAELDEQSNENLKDIRSEWILEIRGLVQSRGDKQQNLNLATGTVEILAKEIKVITRNETLPIDIHDETLTLETHLDNAPITYRADKWRALFKIQTAIVQAFRNFLTERDFTEFQCPKIVGESTEGGANVFSMEYFGHKAYLAQSPQFYKQIMVGVFERVFTVGNVYRAEKHATTRHVNEYTSLDLEFGMIKDHTDVMELETEFLKYLLNYLDKHVSFELKLWNYNKPLLPEIIPNFKLKEVLQLVKEHTGIDHTAEPDLEPNEERWMCEYVKEKFNSDFVFVTHYPTTKRPVYTYPDEADLEYTKSFDMLFRGVEVTTGGQRINDYDQLLKNIEKWGYKAENFEFYLKAFKYGMPPEGGLAIGLERFTAKILGLDNVKEATLFPRDLNRIDLPLSKPVEK